MTWKLSEDDRFDVAVRMTDGDGHRCILQKKSAKIDDAKLAAHWIWQREPKFKELQSDLIVFSGNFAEWLRYRAQIPQSLNVELLPNNVESVLHNIGVNQGRLWNSLTVGAMVPGDIDSCFELDRSTWNLISSFNIDSQWRDGLLAFQAEISIQNPASLLVEIGPGRLKRLDFTRFILADLNAQTREFRIAQDAKRQLNLMKSAALGWGFHGLEFDRFGETSAMAINRRIYYKKIIREGRKFGFAALTELAWKIQQLNRDFEEPRGRLDVHISCGSPAIGWFLQRLLVGQSDALFFPHWNTVATAIWGWNPVSDLFGFIGRRGNYLLVVPENHTVTHLIWMLQK